jgi:hypothetical protein
VNPFGWPEVVIGVQPNSMSQFYLRLRVVITPCDAVRAYRGRRWQPRVGCFERPKLLLVDGIECAGDGERKR